jgi:hypothetical protein
MWFLSTDSLKDSIKRGYMSSQVRRLMGAAALLLCLQTVVRAQDAAIHLTPRIGYLDPLSSPVALLDLESGNRASLADAAVLGLALDMELPVPWLTFRTSIDRTIKGELQTQRVVSESCGEEMCSGVTGERISTGVGFSRWSIAADLVFQPVPREWVARPFVLGGVGLSRYSFDGDLGPDESRFVYGLQDRNDASFHLGAGLDVNVAGWIVRSEMGLYLAEHEDRIPSPEAGVSGECSGCTLPIRFDNEEIRYSLGLRIPVR